MYLLSTKCQDFVTRYLGRSLIDPGDPNMREVNRQLLALAFVVSLPVDYSQKHSAGRIFQRHVRVLLTYNIQNPFLMHASLAVAFAYDRYLNHSHDLRRTLEESHHCGMGITLFNQQLREPIETRKKDPIWGTAAALVMLAFSIPDAQTPWESWPLRPSDPSDLEWLRMSTGKMSLWNIANPLRPDSLFRIMAPTFAQMQSPLPERGVTGIAPPLADVCNLEDTSTAEDNPYFEAAHAMSKLQEVPDRLVRIGHAQLFMTSIHGRFELLLREKDPVALLLLFLWYRKAGQSVWWIELRARMECPSICLYLRLHYKEYAAIHVFLPGGSLAT